MRNPFRNFYIHVRFFLGLSAVLLAFVLSFPFPFLLPFAKSLLVFFFIVVLVDTLLLFNKGVRLVCSRELPKVMSLGNEHELKVRVRNESTLAFQVVLVDELPFQFQDRNNSHKLRLLPNAEEHVTYLLRPVQRGAYFFGHINAFLTTKISFVERRIIAKVAQEVPVYPSIMDVKKYELRASSKLSNFFGVKKIRRIGHSYEFEQISDYQKGDNYQSINWKATSKTHRLMVNKYTDEKSQPIYSFIDKSRYMKMPFHEMTLLDYAINASLIISSTVLKKDDKAGLLTFSDGIESFVKAENRRDQLTKILDVLYKQEEAKVEANYELMYAYARKAINSRSLIFLFANFDTVFALERVLPVLRKIARTHMLVVVVFENTELEDYYSRDAADTLEIYNQTIAQKVAFEKKQVIYQLRKYAIQVMYTKPEDLSLNSLNKYLELKSRGMI